MHNSNRVDCLATSSQVPVPLGKRAKETTDDKGQINSMILKVLIFKLHHPWSPFLFGKHVEDVNLATSIIPMGYSWIVHPEGRKLVWSQEREKLDIKEDISNN